MFFAEGVFLEYVFVRNKGEPCSLAFGGFFNGVIGCNVAALKFCGLGLPITDGLYLEVGGKGVDGFGTTSTSTAD